MTAEVETVLDAETISELQPPCERCANAAVWIWRWKCSLCGPGRYLACSWHMAHWTKWATTVEHPSHKPCGGGLITFEGSVPLR